jgi:hypothetical protein
MPNTHPFFYSVEITEEANFTDGPDCIDGAYPNVRQALIEGVGVEFWRSLGSLGGQRFLDALD